MIRFACFVLLCALTAACATTRPSGFVARNDLTVVPFAENGFEVLARPGTVGRDYFCAAGDFALRMRGARAADRVVITQPDGPSRFNPGGRAASFAIAPAGTIPRQEPGITVPARRAGTNYTVAHARALCDTAPQSVRIF